MAHPSHFTLQLLSTHSVDSSPALLLSTHHTRYLVNAPEGISRVCLQSKLSLGKLDAVLVGSLAHSPHAQGLPGVILASVEAGNKRLRVFGPQGITHYLASLRFFTKRSAAPSGSGSLAFVLTAESAHSGTRLIRQGSPHPRGAPDPLHVAVEADTTRTDREGPQL